jgi:hypothetical protein
MLIDVASASQSLYDQIDALRRFGAAPGQYGPAASRRPAFADVVDRAHTLGASQNRVERVAGELRATRLLQFSEPLESDSTLMLTVPHITST